MDAADVDFKLYHWLHSRAPNAVAGLGGSATPSLTLDKIIALSTDARETRTAFNLSSLSLGLGSAQGRADLRQTIAATYDASSSGITAEDVVVANGTTGSNHIVLRSLLSAGDHVICQYPTYGPLIEEPRDIGCKISYLRLDPDKSWGLDLPQLVDLIKPGKTKMLILNNPVNPTGTHLSTDMQKRVIELAKKHDITIHCDEIFRPLFHTSGATATSVLEHADLTYDNVVVTSSLSKCYGLSGVRIGWIATRSKKLREKFLNYRLYSCQACSQIDEAVAVEVLGPRCRSGILQKHLDLAKANLDLIQRFVDENTDQCDWVRPTAGAVAFVRFRDVKTGKAVDDVDFCERLMERSKVLLAPASMCFELPEDKGVMQQEFMGRVRLHFTTTTESLQKGLLLLNEFLQEEKREG